MFAWYQGDSTGGRIPVLKREMTVVRARKKLDIVIGAVPILCGAVAYSVLMAAPSSDMSLWMLRKTAIKGICICCLVQGLLVVWFLAMRSWRRCLLALALFAPLFILAFTESFAAGPDIGTIRGKVAAATGCQPSQLTCLGGALRRESVILLKPESGFSLPGDFIRIPKNDHEIYRMISEILTFEGLHTPVVPCQEIAAFKYRLDYDTVVAVNRDGEWRIIFLGMLLL